jgi:hypothetical protein
MRDSGLSLSTITKVTIHVWAKVSDGSGTAKWVIRTGGVDILPATGTSLTTNYAEITNSWTKNPNTSADWTWAEIDALEAGVALYHTDNGYARCTQVYVEVEYVPLDTTATPLILRPNAVGTTTNLQRNTGSNNYEMVDDVSPDGDTTRVYRSSDGTRVDAYGIPDAALDVRPIESVTVHIVVAMDSSASGSAKEVIRIGGNNYYGNTESLTTSYVDKYYTWTTNPSTVNLAWTWADIDALESGVELTRSGGSNSVKCTQVWVEVIYTP